MAGDRTVKVNLKLDASDYTSGLVKAAAGARTLGNDVEKTVSRDLPPVFKREGERGGGILAQGFRTGFMRNSPLIAAAIGGGLALGAPAVLAGAGVLFGAVGALAAAQTGAVRTSWSRLGTQIRDGAVADAAGLIPVYEQMADKIGAAFERMRPEIRAAFEASAPQVERLSDGLIRAGETALPALVRAVQSGAPVIEGLSALMENVGDGLAGFLDNISDNSGAAGQALHGLGTTLEAALPLLGDLLGTGVELAADVLPALGGSLSLVADVVHVLAPILPSIVAGFTGFKAAQLAAGYLQTFALNSQMAAVAMTGNAAAGQRMGGALSNLADGVGRTAAALPALGIVAAGIANSHSKAAEEEDKWAQAILAGGKAATEAYSEYESGTHWGQSVDEATGLAGSWGDAKVKADELKASMTPLQQAQAAVTYATNELEMATGRYGPRSDEVRVAQERLTGATATLEQRQIALRIATESATVASGGFIPAINLVGDTTGMTVAQFDAAIAKIDQWRTQLLSISTSFVDPLNTYRTLLEAKSESERKTAQATADMTVSSQDSWRDYLETTTVTLDELAAKLEEQVAAQQNWQTNIVTITQRGGFEVGQAIAAMGEEGVQLAAQMATGTDAEFQRMAAAILADTRMGGEAANAQFDTSMRVMAAIGKAGANATVTSIAHELGVGVTTVARIASQYGATLAGGINPILGSLGKQQIHMAPGGGNIGFAEGGYTGPGGKYTPAGIVHRGEVVWSQDDVDAHGGPRQVDAMRQYRGYAEGGIVGLGRRFQAMGASVSEHPAFGGVSMGGHGRTSLHYTGQAIDVNTRPGTSSQEQRELAPLRDLANRLGFRTIFMAPGHFNHLHADTGGAGGSMGGAIAPAVVLPQPPSTAPYSTPISTAGDAAMSHLYEQATAWVAENSIAPEPEGGGGGGGGSERWRGTVLQALGMVGQPASLVGATLRRLQQESGGNPRAQNNSDSNARRGTPSKGLMQVIDPTFRAYAMPGHNDIWNPLDNILASMRYAMSRYGSLSAAYNKAGGYANGGSTPAGEPFWVGEGGPELMWSNRAKYVSTAQQSRELSGGGGVGGGGTISVAPPVVKVFLDGQEWRGIARVEAEGVVVEAFTGATTRGRNNP